MYQFDEQNDLCCTCNTCTVIFWVLHCCLYTKAFFIWIMNKWITWTWLFFLSTTIKVQILGDCSKQNHRGYAYFWSELYYTICINSIIQFGPKSGFTCGQYNLTVTGLCSDKLGHFNNRTFYLGKLYVCTETNLSMKSAVLVNASSVKTQNLFTVTLSESYVSCLWKV